MSESPEETLEWLNKIESYNAFYKQNIPYINCYLIYMNDEKEIIHVEKTKYQLHDNGIPEGALVHLVKKHKPDKSYVLDDIIQYSFNPLEYDIWKHKDRKEAHEIRILTILDKAVWKPCVELMHDVNALYILYKQELPKPSNIRAKTRKLSRTHSPYTTSDDDDSDTETEDNNTDTEDDNDNNTDTEDDNDDNTDTDNDEEESVDESEENGDHSGETQV